MKEAAGEANLTVVAIILIGVIVAIATPIITNIMTGMKARSCCVDAGGEWKGGKCSITNYEANCDLTGGANRDE